MKLMYSAPVEKLDFECISCTLPTADSHLLAFTENWKIVLPPNQFLLGYLIVASRRHVARFCDLSQAEAREFFELIQILEPSLEKSFEADLVNYSCLRNWAYREKNPDPKFQNGKPSPHVHWHVVPRYKNPKEFAGVLFEDLDFGEPYQWGQKEVSREVLDKVRAKLHEELKVIQ